jgi:Bacterial membrane protein YfhO
MLQTAVSPMAERWQRWKGYVIPPVVLLLGVLAICWRTWTPIQSAQRAFPWDAQWEYWPDLVFQIEAVKDGEAPLWNPYDRLGYPFVADPQPGMLYPVTWVAVVVGLVAGAKFWLITAKTIFHMWWWALGVYVWLRRRQLPPAACYAAGISCVLAYPAVYWFSALNWGMAWTAWVLLAVDVWAEAPSRRGAAWLALALGMCFLAGAPASFWWTLLVVIPYAVWALVHHARAGDRRSYRRAALSSAALAAGLFVVIVLGQVLATSALVPQTVRAERSLEFIADSKIIADDLLGILLPRVNLDLYAGMVAVLAALAALTVRPSGWSYTLAGTAIGGALLAIGSGAGFLPSFASFFPVAGLFRIAHRYTYVMIVPIAALGAEGLATLARLDSVELRRRVGRWLAAIGCVAAVVLGVGIVTTPRGPAHDSYIYGLFSWLLSAWVLRQVVAGPDRWRMVFLGFAAAILAGDLWFARSRTIEQSWWPMPATPNDAEVAKLPGVPLEARIFDREYLRFRGGTRNRIRDLAGYEGDPLALRRYIEVLDLAYQEPHVLGHANVAYVTGSLGGKRPLPLPADFKKSRPQIYEVPVVAPAVGWYPTARIVAGEAAAIAALKTTTPGTSAILEEPTLEAGEKAAVAGYPGGPVVAGKIVELRRNHLVAEVDAPAAGAVVVDEAYHPGWSATVDGQAARIVPANGAFRGLLVGPGKHRIEMTFHAGLPGWIMLLSPIGMAAALVLTRRRAATERLRDRPTPP